jgi:hypothetical protein
MKRTELMPPPGRVCKSARFQCRALMPRYFCFASYAQKTCSNTLNFSYFLFDIVLKVRHFDLEFETLKPLGTGIVVLLWCVPNFRHLLRKTSVFIVLSTKICILIVV